MAEQTILVCDVCGKPATQTVRLVIGRRTVLRDYCSSHLGELTANARSPRRGRPATASGGGGASAKRGGRKRSTGGTRAPRTRGAGKRRQFSGDEIRSAIKQLRDTGLTYRQIGEELLAKGMRPVRAKQWNPVVIGRLLKPNTKD